jgi:hypothetical protein
MNNYSESLESEYLAYVRNAASKGQNIDWSKVLDLLCSEGDWTYQGAQQLISIAQDYGSFFLKNAYALAKAANIEDGQLGL